MATCRSCNAPIEWATWEDSGKPVPVNIGAAPGGNLAMVAGKVHLYRADDARLARERRVSHFATCPDALSWRNR